MCLYKLTKMVSPISLCYRNYHQPFISHYLSGHIITLNIEKVKQVNLWGHKQIIQKDIWMGCDQNQTKSKLWLPVASLPLSCDSHEMKVDMSNDQKILYLKQSNETRLPHQSTFLQSKQDHCLVLHPEVSVYTKSLLQYESDVWGENVQKWTITKVSDTFLAI